MSKTPQRSLPSFGHTVPGEGGILGAILRGNIIAGTRQPDYALIVAPDDLGPLAWGQRGKDVHAVAVLASYADRIKSVSHHEAITARLHAFHDFAAKNPARMKEPDTAAA